MDLKGFDIVFKLAIVGFVAIVLAILTALGFGIYYLIKVFM